MSVYDSPSLDALNRDERAAWLWDTDRRRIVWANPAGLAFWGTDSLFDMLDRVFDASEPGVDRLIPAGRTLASSRALCSAITTL